MRLACFMPILRCDLLPGCFVVSRLSSTSSIRNCLRKHPSRRCAMKTVSNDRRDGAVPGNVTLRCLVHTPRHHRRESVATPLAVMAARVRESRVPVRVYVAIHSDVWQSVKVARSIADKAAPPTIRIGTVRPARTGVAGGSRAQCLSRTHGTHAYWHSIGWAGAF
jgi:hypothetical protein